MPIKNNCCDFPDIGTIPNDCSKTIYLPREIRNSESHFVKLIYFGIVPFTKSHLINRDFSTGYIGYFNGINYFVIEQKKTQDAHS